MTKRGQAIQIMLTPGCTLSASAVGRQVGMDPSSARKLAREIGYSVADLPPRPISPQDAEIRRIMLEEGLPLNTIARRLGIHRKVVARNALAIGYTPSQEALDAAIGRPRTTDPELIAAAEDRRREREAARARLRRQRLREARERGAEAQAKRAALEAAKIARAAQRSQALAEQREAAERARRAREVVAAKERDAAKARTAAEKRLAQMQAASMGTPTLRPNRAASFAATAHAARTAPLPPVTQSEADRLVAEFLAKRGATVCPPALGAGNYGLGWQAERLA